MRFPDLVSVGGWGGVKLNGVSVDATAELITTLVDEVVVVAACACGIPCCCWLPEPSPVAPAVEATVVKKVVGDDEADDRAADDQG